VRQAARAGLSSRPISGGRGARIVAAVRDVLIAGAGMTRFGKFPQRSLKRLAGEAVADALDDAGTAAADVELVFFANAAAGVVNGQESIRGQATLRETALHGVPVVNVENACASASTAVHLAVNAVGSGQCEVAVAVGAEKLHHPDRSRTAAAFAGAIDVERREELEARVYGEAGGAPGAGSLFMDVYADLARRYMERSGATVADLAAVAVKARANGALNERAQFRETVSVDEVLAARPIAGPLTLFMCSPIGDGAAALVLCSRDHARRTAVAQPVLVRGAALVSGSDDETVAPAVTRAARRAYAQAGVGPEDVDVVELHDAAAPAELIAYEELGLCAEGEAPALLASGATALGGRVPVNPSGGLLARGHPIGATGCAQLVELVDELRGRCGDRQVPGARVALAENAGGFLGRDGAAATVTILEAA
jgi:acetyl-CoA acetyltransferase